MYKTFESDRYFFSPAEPLCYSEKKIRSQTIPCNLDPDHSQNYEREIVGKTGLNALYANLFYASFHNLIAWFLPCMHLHAAEDLTFEKQELGRY